METSLAPNTTLNAIQHAVKVDEKTKDSVVGSWRKKLVIFSLKFQLSWLALIYIKKPLLTWKALSNILYLVNQYFGGHGIPKVAKVGSKYYWDMYGPSWPSLTFQNHVQDEFNRHLPNRQHTAMRTVLLAVTSKCPMQCEHCFEWDNLNKPETLSLLSLKNVISELQQIRTCQVYFGGGEPMMRYEDILELLKSTKPGTEFWLATSGYNLTQERAVALKLAGLTGVSISLDHYLPDEHNAFRHHNQSFYWANLAASSSRKAGLVVAMSLCATKNFTTKKNLMEYASLAKDWGASFIQILEPRAVGHYSGKDVSLSEVQKKYIEDFTRKVNYEKAFKKFPIIIYHETYMKSIGCFGAGDRSIYIDPIGNVHACPFCRKACGNILHEPLHESIVSLRNLGCPVY